MTFGRYFCDGTVLSGNIWQELEPEPKLWTKVEPELESKKKKFCSATLVLLFNLYLYTASVFKVVCLSAKLLALVAPCFVSSGCTMFC